MNSNDNVDEHADVVSEPVDPCPECDHYNGKMKDCWNYGPRCIDFQGRAVGCMCVADYHFTGFVDELRETQETFADNPGFVSRMTEAAEEGM